MLVHLLVVQLASCRTQEEVGRAARPAQKLAPQGVLQGTWVSSKSKEMMLVCARKNKNDTSIDPKQVGGKQNNETEDFVVVGDNALPATRPKPRQATLFSEEETPQVNLPRGQLAFFLFQA